MGGGGLFGRIARGEDGAVIGASKIPVIDVIGRLEAGEAPAHLVSTVGLDPRDVVAALAWEALGAAAGPGLPLVQNGPRNPKLASAVSAEAVSGLFPKASKPARLALAAGLLQIYDFWDASHTAAQEADDLGEGWVSAYWHGVAHRREPDAGNAGYWFRKVGSHPVCGPIAVEARPLVDDGPLAAKLFAHDAWQPQAFNEYCTTARRGDGTLARELQKVELAALIEASLPA